jgi:hypothetical protein
MSPRRGIQFFRLGCQKHAETDPASTFDLTTVYLSFGGVGYVSKDASEHESRIRSSRRRGKGVWRQPFIDNQDQGWFCASRSTQWSIDNQENQRKKNGSRLELHALPVTSTIPLEVKRVSAGIFPRPN